MSEDSLSGDLSDPSGNVSTLDNMPRDTPTITVTPSPSHLQVPTADISEDEEVVSESQEDESTSSSTDEDQDNTNDVANDLRPQGERQLLKNPVRSTPQPDLGSIIPKVRKCNWEAFVNRFSEDEPTYAIDALEAGDLLSREMTEEVTKRYESDHFQTGNEDAVSGVNRIHSDTIWVQRVRIQSPALLQVLDKITGYTWAADSCTFLYPFQYFLHHHAALRNELERMEILEKKKLEDTNENTSGDQLNVVEHLRCYIDFVESDILSRYNTFRGDVHSDVPRVRFRDLWYLFRHGDLIYIPDKTLRRYTKDSNTIMASTNSDTSTMRQKIWRLCCIVDSPRANSVVSVDNGSSEFGVIIYFLDYDGTAYSPFAMYFPITHFDDQKDVRDLDYYPLRYAKGASRLMEEHISIGNMFTSYRKEWHMRYSGWSMITDPIGWPITERNGLNLKEQVRPTFIDGDVIIDFEEAYNAEPQLKSAFADPESWVMSEPIRAANALDFIMVWSDSQRSKVVSGSHEVVVISDNVELLDWENYLRKDRYLKLDRDLTAQPSGDDLALLPPRLFVYSLKIRKFFPVDVRHLKSLDWQNDGFSQLQLPDTHKRVIQSSVRSHLKRKPIEREIENGRIGALCTQDFIRGKGQGLIIMLHGEPGTGKTATAEALAQMHRRPLFPLFCGDTNNPFQAESMLEETFRLSDLWDCILLLDEADVFLSARTPTSDLARNSIVSGIYETNSP